MNIRTLSATTRSHRRVRPSYPRSPPRSIGIDPPAGGSFPSGLSNPVGVISEPGAEIYKFLTLPVTLNNGGGAVVGSARLVLLFWGEFWQTANNPSAADITAAVTDIVNSPYLSELSQYGFRSLTIDPPVIVIQPVPPSQGTPAKTRKTWSGT